MANTAAVPRWPFTANCWVKFRRAVGVGHCACREQEQLTEIPLIQRKTGNLLSGEPLATGGLMLRVHPDREYAVGAEHHDRRAMSGS